jgi:hypothetical protein
VNLACKAVLSAITNMDFLASNHRDTESDTSDDEYTLAEAIKCDPIANLRTLVRVVRDIYCRV